MATNYKASNADLDTIFASGTRTGTSNYKAGSSDLNTLLKASIDGSTDIIAFNTNIFVNGVDMRYLYQDVNYIGSTPTPTPTPTPTAGPTATPTPPSASATPTPTPTPTDTPTPTPTPTDTPTPTPTPIPSYLVYAYNSDGGTYVTFDNDGTSYLGITRNAGTYGLDALPVSTHIFDYWSYTGDAPASTTNKNTTVNLTQDSVYTGHFIEIVPTTSVTWVTTPNPYAGGYDMAVVLQVTSNGDTPKTYEWYMSGVSSGGPWTYINVTSVDTYQFPNANFYGTMWYQCVVKNNNLPPGPDNAVAADVAFELNI